MTAFEQAVEDYLSALRAWGKAANEFIEELK